MKNTQEFIIETVGPPPFDPDKVPEESDKHEPRTPEEKRRERRENIAANVRLAISAYAAIIGTISLIAKILRSCP